MRDYVCLTIFAAIFSAIFIGLFTYFFDVDGAILGFVISQLFLFFSCLLFKKKIPVKIRFFQKKTDVFFLKKLLAFSLMTITSALLSPLAQILIRSYVIKHGTWAEAGYWQAILRISDGYLSIITAIISAYALPKYSRIVNSVDLKAEVFLLTKRLLPAVIFLASMVYIFRHWVILILFSKGFFCIESALVYQLIGDVIKISSFIVAYTLLAKAQVKVHVILEVVFTSIFFISSIEGFRLFGIQGLTMAFLFTCSIYYIVVLAWFMRFAK
jgi:PST family polysaccharide transporter